MSMVQFDNQFQTALDNQDVSIAGLKGSGEEVTSCNVFWSINPEFHKDQIKTMNVKVNRVICNIDYYEEGKEEKKSITVDTDSPEYKDFHIRESEFSFTPSGAISVYGLFIDFDNTEIDVN